MTTVKVTEIHGYNRPAGLRHSIFALKEMSNVRIAQLEEYINEHKDEEAEVTEWAIRELGDMKDLKLVLTRYYEHVWG